ncbi:outer membrane protein assembly factor BamE [Geminicoccaceae bacterium 1502E]|nr:outer membrane protein assembly factor BamE [Geminicoccaceae bacterium 1502E]
MTAKDRRYRGLYAAVALCVTVGACSPTVKNHGYRIDETRLAQITPGVTSREEVRRLLGSPSAAGTFEDDRWYYISQKTERMSFYQAELVAQDVVGITFDERGIVAGIEQRGLEDAQAVEPSDDTTRTLGNDLTVLQQLLGNVGRFNTGPRTPTAPR